MLCFNDSRIHPVRASSELLSVFFFSNLGAGLITFPAGFATFAVGFATFAAGFVTCAARCLNRND
jgi:hypothetical protein